MIGTYIELGAAITNWTKRSDLAAYNADFISLAEARIGREVKARQMEQRVSTTPSTIYTSLPSDFVAMRGVRIQGSTSGWMSFITPDQFFNEFPSSVSSTSKKYTIFGDELIFPSVPTGGIELWYYKRLAALSSATNSLFTSNPDLYLFGALEAAMPFMKDDKRVLLWEGKYAMVRDQVNETERAGRYPAGMVVKVA